MADADWKLRVGIDIDFSTDEDDDSDSAETICSNTDGATRQYHGEEFTDSTESQELEEALHASSIEEVLNQWADQYGSTPPRTRIKNKNRSSKQRMEGTVKMRTGGRLARPRTDRRNTVDCALLNQMIMEPANSEEKVRSDKRSTQLLRESERDIKMSATATALPMRSSANYGSQLPTAAVAVEERAESLPLTMPANLAGTGTLNGAASAAPPTLIESCNRFMSVTSRPVGCRISAPPVAYRDIIFTNQSGPFEGIGSRTAESVIPQNRINFHATFSDLIKLGSVDKERAARSGILSNEERLWQTHVNDLIWLELQAWHADRSIEQQDRLLCQARQEIGDLLDEIMCFRFQRKPSSVRRTGSEVSTTTDSGIETATTSGSGEENRFCFGCLSMYCKDCLEVQTAAMKQVEELLLRLESKECLFPSSRAMGNAFPVYQSEAFVNRVKAMCLWYNMTRQHRMTLLILGKLLARLQGPSKKESSIHWPIMDQHTEGSTSSSVQDESGSSADSGAHYTGNGGTSASTGSLAGSGTSSNCSKRVQFADNGSYTGDGSASESVNSDETDFSDLSLKRERSFPGDTEYGRYMNNLNYYNEHTLTELSAQTASSMGNALYRKYIENVLKCRGLGKSLTFLHRLHNVVLRKAQLTLEKPGRQQEDDFLFDEEDVPCIEPPLEREQEIELRRYGAWSEEAKQLNLPSYVSAFLFLSLIPLEVIHEFLKMRLETRPKQPNPLSLEQHIKELKEGLTLAMIHRERFQKHVNTVLSDREQELDKYMHQMELFDETVRNIFELYLELCEQWILDTVPEGHQKAVLDEEWRFTKLISPMIPRQHGPAAKRFCSIVERVLERTGSEMMRQLKELMEKSQLIDTTADKKWQFFALCRETQRMFTSSREKALKTMAFAKTLFRDLEHADFHRDHCEEDSENEMLNDDDDLELIGVVLRSGSMRRRCPANAKSNNSSPVCSEVVESLQMLKRNALLLRNKLAAVIEELQLLCSDETLEEFDETDRIGALTRVREILHQGYKFGFEYHKDVARLYETKLNNCRDAESELMLAKAIIQFAKLWMNFVMERCERGRGLRPRWANQGLEFLIAACDPQCTSHLTDTEFEDLKLKMDACISHVIGNIREPERIRKSPRSRKSSPSPSAAAVVAAGTAAAGAVTTGRASIPMINLPSKSFHNQLSLREDGVMLRANSPIEAADMFRKQTSCDGVNEVKIRVPSTPNAAAMLGGEMCVHGTRPLRQLRIRDAVNKLDSELDEWLRERNLIGNVKEISYYSRALNRARSVNFSWHRGIKIGQGRFGKVYTAVNNSTGELMAMKEIAIQPGETAAIRKVAEELKIFEGISHQHLVKYYGVEVHREELIIFMELCPEGTLESLVELNGGLPEAHARRYTHQLLSAVAELHRNGVVHRDIKTANIFLHKDGNYLKLGDFGSAVKIQAHTTMAGELKGYVGTQAYMAPEVFTRNNTEGHGRAADIWSIGCVVVEMSSGRRPWHQFDSNFQIMFKVGMGESPEIPDNLSEEGKDFVGICLQHDPKDRQKADELLQHIFCKFTFYDSEAIDKKLRGTFRRNLKSSSS
ncbi:mitogen-activated protein kinase kinase kinase 4 isoform X1 [Anopheles funestus]|uniref:mitogen-activated protein kinase kinase kinase 4 isoform X1 n=2 Tax=Anopheles funestus TaxID=62324 RepID=UPI0020C6CEB9|nr:mitogen-activated protein kinase kinase kinase 4 isoform X1 [Anopheles funestus]